VSNCPNCGKKIGFMGAKKCGVCGTDMCKACTKYLTTDKGKGSLAAKMPQGPAKNALCSDECAKRSYGSFQKDIGGSAFVQLTNENNDRFFLMERNDENDFRSRFFTIPNAPDGRKRPAGDLIPELVPIHSYMQQDLEGKDIMVLVSYTKVSRG
jgi:hypothetical protein